MAIMNGGRILQQTTPIQATESLRGTIWQKTIPRDEFETAEAIYDLLSSGYNPDNSINIRVHADTKPGPDFELVTPDLEDVYFIALKADELAHA